jgi:hypothetical protein
MWTWLSWVLCTWSQVFNEGVSQAIWTSVCSNREDSSKSIHVVNGIIIFWLYDWSPRFFFSDCLMLLCSKVWNDSLVCEFLHYSLPLHQGSNKYLSISWVTLSPLLNNLIKTVKFSHFCHVLLVRKKSHISFTLTRKRLDKRNAHQRWDFCWPVHLRRARILNLQLSIT